MTRLLSGAVVVGLIASACSLGPREEWAEAVHRAPDMAREAGTARVRMTVAVEVIETNIRQTPRPLIASLEGVADFRNGRARLIGPEPQQPTVLYDDLTVYLPRSPASIGSGGRPWVGFNFKRKPSVDIDDNDRRMAVGAGLLSPVLALHMLRGVLTGSIERAGVEQAGEANSTRYVGRLSKDAAAREVDDEATRAGILRAFETHGVREDVFPIEAWIDDDGLARGVRFLMRQQKDRVNAFELRALWEFLEYGVEADITLPPRGDTIESRRFLDFVVEFIRQEV